jgi:hypothetical protein
MTLKKLAAKFNCFLKMTKRQKDYQIAFENTVFSLIPKENATVSIGSVLNG